ncbi:selenocysteine-specific translation elongation factor [Ornatilinea apprima]|nr:selenocysteine-specific translation elongation factor [Ornatilinea apprima]
MRVIGTAGHVDHGKSTLVATLTGTHPDRLKEEQEREMTIDLGFAWLTLPDGEEVGIVDVPGHRDFIENMLAGVGGIDLALFVVAADEGVMPQTREHLAILDILKIPAGVVALTKIDLAPDAEWLDLIEMDVRETLAGSVLDGAPVVRVSARSGAGITELKQTLAASLAGQPRRLNRGKARLPVDRVFSVAGFGTVVTGTLLDGDLKVGDEVEILPPGIRGRVRGLQSHKQKENQAQPGSRTAVNLSGVDTQQVRRGLVVCKPGFYRATQRFDAQFDLRKESSIALKHDTQVKLFIGAEEVVARVRVMGVEEIAPGESGWLQIETSEPVVVARGDRYLLRRPSPSETLGGGMVVEAHPERRYKRFSASVLERFAVLAQGNPQEILLQTSSAAGMVTGTQLIKLANLPAEEGKAALAGLVGEGALALLEPQRGAEEGLVMAQAAWQALSENMAIILERYHQSFPLRAGMLREELKSRLGLEAREYNAALQSWAAEDRLRETNRLVGLSSHKICFTPAQQSQVNTLLKKFADAPTSPPGVKECVDEVGEEIYNALTGQGLLLAVSKEVVFRKEDFDRMLEMIREEWGNGTTFTMAQARDRLQTSRKYAVALLEYLDEQKITVREGDARRITNLV